MANMVKTKSPEALITKPWDTFSNILLVCVQFVSHLTCFSYCWYVIVWFLYYEVLFGYNREMAHSYFKLDGIAVDLGLDHSIYKLPHNWLYVQFKGVLTRSSSLRQYCSLTVHTYMCTEKNIHTHKIKEVK